MPKGPVQKVVCDCGSHIATSQIEQHRNSMSHVNVMRKKEAAELKATIAESSAKNLAAPNPPVMRNLASILPDGKTAYDIARERGIAIGKVDPDVINETDYSQIPRKELNPGALKDHLEAQEYADQSDMVTPLPPEDVQRNAPVPSMVNDHLSSSQFQHKPVEEDDEFERFIAKRTGVIDPADVEVEFPPIFEATTPDEENPERPVLITPDTIETRDRQKERIEDPGYMEVVNSADQYDKVVGDQVRKDNATFPWCFNEMSKNSHVFTRYYYRKRLLLDRFTIMRENEIREIQQKRRQITQYNMQCDPEDRLGYIPIMVNMTLSRLAVDRAMRGETIDLTANVHEDRPDLDLVPTMVDGVITMRPRNSVAA